MASRCAIVTAADENYSRLVLGLIQSLHDSRAASLGDIHVIDLGLAQSSMDALKPLVTSIIPGKWDLDFPSRPQAPRWFQAMTARPFLPDYLPDYDIFIWIDSDAWVADQSAVKYLIDGAKAQNEGFVIVPEIHPSYSMMYQVLSDPRRGIYRCYEQAWGNQIAKAIAPLPNLNSGVLGIRRGHRVWSAWAERLKQGLQRSHHQLLEQCALNLAIYLDGVSISALPAWCNWLVIHGRPNYNPASKRFEEPIRPHQPLAIVHCANYRNRTVEVAPSNAKPVDVPFDYLSLKHAGVI